MDTKNVNNPCERCNNFGCPSNPNYCPSSYSRNPIQKATDEYHQNWMSWWGGWID